MHVLLFTYLPLPIAAAATLLSLAMSFPLARLYDLGGATIWAPAILHFVAQGAIKLVVAPDDRQMILGIGWMGVCALLPWAAFAIRRRPTPAGPPGPPPRGERAARAPAETTAGSGPPRP